MTFIRLLVAALLIALVPLAPAVAQELTQAEVVEIAQYRLTEDVLHRMEAVKDDMVRRSLAPDTSRPINSLTDMVAALERNPEILKSMARNRITSREFIIALAALFQAVAQSRESGSTFADKPLDSLPPDQANLLFYFQHREEIDAFLSQGLSSNATTP